MRKEKTFTTKKESVNAACPVSKAYRGGAGFARRDDRVDLGGVGARAIQRILQRLPWESALQLDARETLLAGRVHDLAIDHQRHGRIFVQRGQP